MATETNHLALANRNHEALLHLIRGGVQFPEWVATVAFYKAVQLVEAAFCKVGRKHCQDHRKRHEELKRTPIFRYMYGDYRVLWSASCIARYLCDDSRNGTFNCFADFMAPTTVVDELVKKRLHAIETQIFPHLSDDGKKTLIRLDPGEL